MTTSEDFILCRMTVSLQSGSGTTLRAGWIYWLLATDPEVQGWLSHDPPWAIHEVELEAESDALDEAEAEIEEATADELKIEAELTEATPEPPPRNNDHEDDGA